MADISLQTKSLQPEDISAVQRRVPMEIMVPVRGRPQQANHHRDYHQDHWQNGSRQSSHGWIHQVSSLQMLIEYAEAVKVCGLVGAIISQANCVYKKSLEDACYVLLQSVSLVFYSFSMFQLFQWKMSNFFRR